MFLWDIAHQGFQRFTRIVCNRPTVDGECPFTNWVLAQELADQAGLACPGLADKPQSLTCFQGQADILQTRLGSLSIGEAVIFQTNLSQMVQVLSAIFLHIIPSLDQFLELTEGSLPGLID